MVDSNGELKKRINEDRKKYGGEDADYIVMERHLKVLDEAKADLAQEIKVITKNSHIIKATTHNEDVMKDLLIASAKLSVFEIWFKRWFGDSK